MGPAVRAAVALPTELGSGDLNPESNDLEPGAQPSVQGRGESLAGEALTALLHFAVQAGISPAQFPGDAFPVGFLKGVRVPVSVPWDPRQRGLLLLVNSLCGGFHHSPGLLCALLCCPRSLSLSPRPQPPRSPLPLPTLLPLPFPGEHFHFSKHKLFFLSLGMRASRNITVKAAFPSPPSRGKAKIDRQCTRYDLAPKITRLSPLYIIALVSSAPGGPIPPARLLPFPRK